MLDPEDVDLSKALSRLSKLAVRLAEDVAREFSDVQRALEIVDVLDETARLVQVRLINAPPAVIDSGDDPADRLAGDDRLAAGLTLNAYQQCLAAQEIRLGQFDQAERDELADAMATLARELRHGTDIPVRTEDHPREPLLDPPRGFGWSASGPFPEMPPTGDTGPSVH